MKLYFVHLLCKDFISGQLHMGPVEIGPVILMAWKMIPTTNFVAVVLCSLLLFLCLGAKPSEDHGLILHLPS